jgi:hypothetical protein
MWIVMQISLDYKQHYIYQYDAFGEAFIHTKDHFGKHRWSDDASLRIDMCGGFMAVGMAMRILLD